MSGRRGLNRTVGLVLGVLGLVLAPSVSTGQSIEAQSPAPRAAPAVTSPEGPAQPPADLEAYVDGIVRDSLVRDHIVGATVAIVQDGEILLKKGYGAASLSPWRPVDPDRTLFRLGSVSKTFTWLTVMKEAEAGRLRLDAPINLFLPEGVQVRDQGYASPVTLRSLMSHSGGFEDRALGHLFERNPDRVRSLEDYLRQERPRRVRPVGSISSYSNYGVALAGEAAAWVSGKTFERLAEESLFEPMGMSRTTFREPRPARPGLPAPMPPHLSADLSEGFSWTGSGYAREPFEYIGQIAPAGSASSTAGDMARYMITLLNAGQVGEGRIFGDSTARALQQPLRRTPPGVNGWPHGFISYPLPWNLSGLGHDGATLTFMSNMTLAPELRLGVFVSTNTNTGHALTERLASRIVERLSGRPAAWPRPASPELWAVRSLYEGRYLGSRRAYSGLEGMLLRLQGQMQVHVTPEGRLVTMTGGRVQTWVPEGAAAGGRFISDAGWQRLVFLPERGKARQILTSVNGQVFERIPFWSRPGVLASAAAAAGFAALATLGVALFRNRRDFRQTHIQARAGLFQGLQSILWLLSMGLALAWGLTATEGKVIFDWPGLLPLAASACALVASLLSLLTLGMAPLVLRSGRRLDSWTPVRRAGFVATSLASLIFAVLLGLWGGLAPWAG